MVSILSIALLWRQNRNDPKDPHFQSVMLLIISSTAHLGIGTRGSMQHVDDMVLSGET